jgi:hypothetical protein
MSNSSKCLVLGLSLVIFGNGVYFGSKAAMALGSFYAVLAILDTEIGGMD